MSKDSSKFNASKKEDKYPKCTERWAGMKTCSSFLPTLLLEGLNNCYARSSVGFFLPGPSTASLIKDIVESILHLVVLWFVIVVPQLKVLL